MSTTLALLPSPLLGPAVWTPVAALLVERGWTVTIPPAFDRITNPGDVLAHWDRALPDRTGLVLVPHSNAGLYIPALGERRRVLGAVFVDAALPPVSGSTPMAPPGLYRMLGELADGDGLLPRWTEWWGDADLSSLFPDAATRDAVAAEQVRVPLSYFAERMPVAAGWTKHPSAYLAFGDTYQRERQVAVSSGWPVRTLPGDHLMMLMEPARVASELEKLLGLLGIGR